MTRKLDPRVKRTRKMFENALLELIEEKEYTKITVQEITDRAGLNRATFYLHFYDKDKLLEKCLNTALQNLRDSIKMPDYEFTYDGEQPHPTFIRLLENMVENSRFYKIMLVKEKIPYFTDQVLQVIEELVEQGLQFLEKDNIKHRVAAPIMRSYISSAYLGSITWWVRNDMPFTPRYMATQLTIMSTVGSFVDNPYIKR